MKDETEKNIELQQSTEISVNQKGIWSGKVKVYAMTPEESYNVAVKQAEALTQIIKLKNGG